MRATETYKYSSCRGSDDGTVTVELTAAGKFEFKWNAQVQVVNGDEGLIRQCMEAAARESLEMTTNGKMYRVEVLEVRDNSGESAPIAFAYGIQKAIAAALGKQDRDGI